jgi:hypothetical protein
MSALNVLNVTPQCSICTMFVMFTDELSDVNTTLSSVPDTLHVQKLEHHEIGTNLFRRNSHDVIV